MPRISAKKRLLNDIRNTFKPALALLAADDSDSADEAQQTESQEADPSLPIPDEHEGDMYYASKHSQYAGLDDSNSEPEGEAVYTLLATTYWSIVNCCYFMPRQNVERSKEYRYEYFLKQTENDFRCITRLSRRSFDIVHDLIVGDPVFYNASLHKQALVHWQLACTLDRLGNDGQGVSAARSKVIWGLGHGTIFLYYQRVLHALNNLRTRFIRWPDERHRAGISRSLECKGFRGAVGFVDGTTFPLHLKPSRHGNTYMDRKKQYSVSAQIVCDHRKQVTHIMVGMPGSVHDSRYFSQSPLLLNAEACFYPGQYLIADSAYACSPYVVPAYKAGQRDDIGDETEAMSIESFNMYLAQARVVNEHTIGMMKSRWSSLRGLRIMLREASDIFKVMQHVVACVVLHNIVCEEDPWVDDNMELGEPEDEDDVDLGAEGRRNMHTAGQHKRYQVRRACLEYHAANQAS